MNDGQLITFWWSKNLQNPTSDHLHCTHTPMSMWWHVVAIDHICQKKQQKMSLSNDRWKKIKLKVNDCRTVVQMKLDLVTWNQWNQQNNENYLHFQWKVIDREQTAKYILYCIIVPNTAGIYTWWEMMILSDKMILLFREKKVSIEFMIRLQVNKWLYAMCWLNNSNCASELKLTIYLTLFRTFLCNIFDNIKSRSREVSRIKSSSSFVHGPCANRVSV